MSECYTQKFKKNPKLIYTLQKMKFSIKNFYSKRNQILRKLI